jgi:hypothetical protein
MKHFFHQDRIIVGIVAALLSILGFFITLITILLALGIPLDMHPRWYGGMFVPLVLLLHHYARRKEQLTVTKTLIVILFITFISFILLIKNL